MKQIFNPDSPVMTALSIVTDFIVLNVIFIILCIPVFTAGGAAAAMLNVMHGYYDEKSDRRLAVFFRTFKACFRTGALLSLLAVLCAAVLIFDTVFLFSVTFPVQSIAFTLLFVGIVLFLSMIFWCVQTLAIHFNINSFNISSKIDNENKNNISNELKPEKYLNNLKLGECLKQARSYAVTYIFETVCCLFIMLLPSMLFFVSGETLTKLLSVFGIIGFSTIFYLQSLVIQLRAWRKGKPKE